MQNKLKFWQDDATSCLTEDVEQGRVSLHLGGEGSLPILVNNLSPHKVAGGPSETRRVSSPHDPSLPSLPCGTARVFPSCLGNHPQQIDCALVKMDVRNGKEQTAGRAPLMGYRATQAERAWDILGD